MAMAARIVEIAKAQGPAQLAKRFAKEESGQTMVEYGLILALVAVVVVGAIMVLGKNLSGIFGGVNADLT